MEYGTLKARRNLKSIINKNFKMTENSGLTAQK